MATENSFLNNALRGQGSRSTSKQNLALTVNGNTTVTGTIAVPDGSWTDAFAIETPTAISGTPTSCLVRIGTTLHGQEIVADVDAKAQGHIAATIVAGFDKVAGMVGKTTYFVEITTSGGTSSAGTINILPRYDAPV